MKTMLKSPRGLPVVLAAAAAFAVPAAAIATGADGASAASTHIVKIKNIMFSPVTLRIHRGDAVKWEFLDGDIDTEHNVTSTGKTHFKSSGSKESGTYTVTFNKKGTYTYRCTIHSNMTAKVVVS
ncbi:MAG TPA: cupredoxin domain-containing protein [Solirubrobacteraceae bacterium]